MIVMLLPTFFGMLAAEAQAGVLSWHDAHAGFHQHDPCHSQRLARPRGFSLLGHYNTMNFESFQIKK